MEPEFEPSSGGQAGILYTNSGKGQHLKLNETGHQPQRCLRMSLDENSIRHFDKPRLAFLQTESKKNPSEDDVGGWCSGSRADVSLRAPHEVIGLVDLGFGLMGIPGWSFRMLSWLGRGRTTRVRGGDGRVWTIRHRATSETSGCAWGDRANAQDPARE